MLVKTEEWTNSKLRLSISLKQGEVATAWKISPSAPKDRRSETAIYLPHICMDCTYGQLAVQKSLQVWNIWDFRCPILNHFQFDYKNVVEASSDLSDSQD